MTGRKEMMRAGEFTYENGTLSGPKQYMEERGNERLEQILAGRCTSFNMTCHLSPSVEMAVLVSLQTDYAGWRGMQSLKRSLGYEERTQQPDYGKFLRQIFPEYGFNQMHGTSFQ